MRRSGIGAVVLSVLLWATIWTGHAFAQVDDAFGPKAELISPEGSAGSRQGQTGESVLVKPGGGSGLFGSASVSPDEAGSGGVWGWVADHGLGLVKGVGAGLIGAAVVGLGALLIGLSSPVLLTVAGAAVLGGAVYGLAVGSRNFNWTEAIVGSIIGGVSAGVGSWLSAAGSAIAAKVGVAVTNVVAGGLTSLSSYLINSPERTWGGALGAFALGSVTSGVFMGVGAAASRFWTWGKGLMRMVGGRQGSPRAMVQAALDVDAPPTRGVPARSAPDPVPTNGISPQTFALKAYVREVETITGYPIPPSQRALLKEAVRETRFEKISREELVRQRKEFMRLRKKLIDEWEQNTGRPWPRYAEPVLSKDGRVLRQVGDNYDAHHIIELSHGGPNEWWNIHPASFPDQHQAGIHGADGMLRKIME